MPIRFIASPCRHGSRNGNTMASRVCMINRAVADQPNSPLTNRHSPNNISTIYQRRAPFAQRGGGAPRPQNREAPQYLDAQTAGQKGTSSMETGAQVVKESPRSAGL